MHIGYIRKKQLGYDSSAQEIMRYIMDELDKKYQNIRYADFGDSTLLSTNEKRLLNFMSYSGVVLIFGMLIILVLHEIFGGISDYLALFFVFLLLYCVWAVFFAAKRTMYHCITKLGREYFEYREHDLIENHRLVIPIPFSFDEWSDDLRKSKQFERGYSVVKKRFPLMFTKGAIYYFDYNIIVFLRDTPDRILLPDLIDPKRINLVFCLKAIESAQLDDSVIRSYIAPGYTEEIIDSQIVRFAEIHYDKTTSQVLHRPRVVLLYPGDPFMSKHRYVREPSVVVDYSTDVSNLILSKVLRLDW